VVKARFKHEPLVDLTVPLPECAKSQPVESVQRPKYHGDDCYCLSCADMRAAVDIYFEQKRIYDREGFV
jgi:hypothetical protein